MVRTQIYLTEEEQYWLRSIAAKTGIKQSELIRNAIDKLIALHQEKDGKEILSRACGIWKDRKDLPDFKKIRKEWDRSEFK